MQPKCMDAVFGESADYWQHDLVKASVSRVCMTRLYLDLIIY